MRSLFLKVAVVGGAAASTLLLGVSQASAVGTFDVTAGNARNGVTVPITGTTQGSSPQVTFTDTTTGTVLNCASSTAAGSTKVGAGQAGRGVGTISGTGTKFNGCTGPLGLNLVVTGSGNWALNALGGNARAVSGSISGVRATVKDSGGGSQCSFSVTGSVAARYTNGSSLLSLPGTRAQLKISNVRGCFGVVANGDLASFKATYKLAANQASYNPVKIVPSA